MKLYRAEGVILRRINIGEADKLITIFTQQFGKKRVVAKGIRKISSRRGPSMELFNRVSVLIYKGKTLDSISECSIIDSYPNFRVELSGVQKATEVCEVIDLLTREDQQHEDVYGRLIDIFAMLDAHAECNMLQFKTSVLTDLGFVSEKQLEGQDIDQTIESIAEHSLRARNSYE